MNLRCILAMCVFCAVDPLFGQTLPYKESFSTSMAGWTAIDDAPTSGGPGAWTAANGILTQSSNVYTTENEYTNFTGTHCWYGGKKWSDYAFNALLRSTDDDGIGILFHYKDPMNYYRFIMVQDVNNKGPFQLLQKRVNGTFTTLKALAPKVAIPSQWFSVTADVRADRITIYLNGEVWGSVIDADLPEGAIGFTCYANEGAAFDSVSVTDNLLIYQKPEALQTERYPNLQLPSAGNMTIGWISATRAIGKIEYGNTPSLGQTWKDSAAVFRHEATLDGLDRSARYYYKIFNDAVAASDVLTFSNVKAADADTTAFIAWGDSGVNTADQYAIAALMERETVDFGIHVGDVNQSNGSEYDVTYYTPYKNILARIPVFPCIGNHDTYFDNTATYQNEFVLPHNNPLATERYYSYAIGSVFALSMDTNLDFSPASPQYQWLVKELNGEERKKHRWTIVYFHHPPYCEAWPEWSGDANVRAYLVPLFESSGVDIVFNGHTHSYEHGKLGRVHYVITGGGGGGLDAIARDIPQIIVSKSQFHFTRARCVGNTMTVMARNIGGAVIDSFAVVKTIAAVQAGRTTDAVPAAYAMTQNFPNPFNPSTRISYTVPSTSYVVIQVFDVLGRIVAELAHGVRTAGEHQADWSAAVPGGMYFYRITADPVDGSGPGYRAVRSMVLLK